MTKIKLSQEMLKSVFYLEQTLRLHYVWHISPPQKKFILHHYLSSIDSGHNIERQSLIHKQP